MALSRLAAPALDVRTRPMSGSAGAGDPELLLLSWNVAGWDATCERPALSNHHR